MVSLVTQQAGGAFTQSVWLTDCPSVQTGDGLGLLQLPGEDKPCRLISVPFTLPGERVVTHVARHEPDFHMSHGDLVSIIKASEKRQATKEELAQWPAPSQELKAVQEKYGSRVQCKYFGQCSGCQVSPSQRPVQ